jgi:hypothetical protein
VHGLSDATSDPVIVAEWWRRWPHANVALATGGVYVVDCDGEEGRREWRALVADHRSPETRWCRTGGGGWHIYYRPSHAGLRSTARRVAPHVDTRGAGGYVLLPPSLHGSGERYEWASQVPAAAMPEWLANLVAPAPPPPRAMPGPATFRYASTAYGQAILTSSLGRVAAAPVGERNTTLAREAFVLGAWSAGGEIDPSRLFEQLVAACPDPDREKVQATAFRQLAAGARYPRRPR